MQYTLILSTSGTVTVVCQYVCLMGTLMHIAAHAQTMILAALIWTAHCCACCILPDTTRVGVYKPSCSKLLACCCKAAVHAVSPCPFYIAQQKPTCRAQDYSTMLLASAGIHCKCCTHADAEEDGSLHATNC